jgi:stage V sporulation protein G
MEITEVRVKLINNKDERLKAFCSMTLDNDFVVRDIKVIEGTNGYFVAMPSRKMSDHCPKCGGKNHLRAKFCNNCAASLGEDRAKKDFKGRMKLHADIAHPINAQCRQSIQEKIVEAFEKELEISAQPGYKPVELDEPDDDVPDESTEES